MRAGKWDLYIEKGAAFKRKFQWLENGVAKPLNGWTARMDVRDPYGVLIVALSTTDGSIVVDDTGNISLYLSGQVTNAFVPLDGTYDLFLFDPNAPLDGIKLVQGQCPVLVATTAVTYA